MTPHSFRLLSGSCLALLILSACGGSGVGPSGVPTPTPQVATHSITLIAFLDENGNGLHEPQEGTRIPGVEMVLGTARGTSAVRTGETILQVPTGTFPLEVTAASLPPFYRPATGLSVSSPATGGQIMVPITLPRGRNRVNVYLAFGDSITKGEPHIGDGTGYRQRLETMLNAHFGSAEVVERGRDATESQEGVEVINRDLGNILPAFALIHYGTNDWNNSACRQIPCFTTTSLRAIVRQVNQAGSHAFLATIIPTNTGWDGRAPASRNEWVASQNAIIKQIAEEEGAVLVDLNDAFFKSNRELSTLFVDHVHPSAIGYEIMAQTWFNAITKAYSKILSTR